MVIQCSSCDTRFKIADDKVKAGGVKVRCSKCKEVFTVLPPDEEPEAIEASSDDLNDLNSTFSSQQEGDQAGSSLDDVDWSSLNSGETEASEEEEDDSPGGISSSDFSFGDDEGEESAFAEDETSTDEFSFDDTDSEAASTDVEDAFSFGGEAEEGADSLGVEDPIGEGAQDEFSFDETPATTDGADDFDWDGSSSDDADVDDSFGFDEGAKDDNLDFSSLQMSTDEEPASLEVEEPSTAPAIPTPSIEEPRPTTVKGPQKSGGKGRGSVRGKHARKKSGPLRSLIMLLLFLAIIVGGGLFGLNQMGFWSGDFAELPDVDYVAAGQTAWDKATVEFDKLVGNEVTLQPAGSITVTEISGKYIQNETSGMLFVIEGKVRNDYTSTRSAIAVLGMLYDTSGVLVNQQKVFCGNVVDDKALRTEKLETIQARGSNEFGDSLSNLDVAPGASLPFTIVFSDLPENLSEYNVEPADSAAGAK